MKYAPKVETHARLGRFETAFFLTETKRYEIRATGNKPEIIWYEIGLAKHEPHETVLNLFAENETEVKRHQTVGTRKFHGAPVEERCPMSMPINDKNISTVESIDG